MEFRVGKKKTQDKINMEEWSFEISSGKWGLIS
jgi:hypothetical protein